MPYRLPCSKTVLQWKPILCHYVGTDIWPFSPYPNCKEKKIKKRDTSEVFKCGESEVKKEGRGQEVEGNREITEVSP